MLKKSLAVSMVGMIAGIAAPASAATYVYNGTGGALPDTVNFQSSFAVPDAFTITDVNLTLNGLSHTYWADLDISLSHGLTSVLITDENGGSSDPNGTFTFDDEALLSVANLNTTGGNFRSLNSLSAFDGQNSAGLWTLRIFDDAGSDMGNLGSWTLTLQGQSTGAVPEPATWAMMLLGFGFVGGAMRSAKRRQKLSVTYA